MGGGGGGIGIQSIPRSRVRLNSALDTLDLCSVGTYSRSGSRERSVEEEPNIASLVLVLLAEFNSFKHVVRVLEYAGGPPAYPIDRGSCMEYVLLGILRSISNDLNLT